MTMVIALFCCPTRPMVIVRAIFGESEPAASDENRDILMKAATRFAWDGT